MKKLAYALSCFALGAALNGPAMAQDMGSTEDSSLISFGVGAYDVNDDDTTADFRLEYRHGKPLFWQVKPWFGAEATAEGSVWGGGGVLVDINVGDVYFTPNFGAGLYGQGGSDKDLGSAIEFRSQIEAGYKFQNEHRVGVAFGHISNASIDDHNPGTEILNLYYHVPVNDLW